MRKENFRNKDKDQSLLYLLDLSGQFESIFVRKIFALNENLVTVGGLVPPSEERFCSRETGGALYYIFTAALVPSYRLLNFML